MEFDFSGLEAISSAGSGPSESETPAARAQKRRVEVSRSAVRQDTDAALQKILQGVKSGESMTALFLLAFDALAVARNEKFLSDAIRADIEAVRGAGLREFEAIEESKAATERRLERLKRALDEAQNSQEAARIRAAIVAHENKIKALEAMKKAR